MCLMDIWSTEIHLIFQPNNTRWLTQAERRLAQVRLAEDAGEADQDSSEASYVILRYGNGKLLNTF